MTQVHARFARYRGRAAAYSQSEIDWVEQLSILSGVWQEFQSSRIGLALLDVAVGRESSLAVILQPAVAEMRQAHQALRQEALGLLDRLAALIDEMGPATGNNDQPQTNLRPRTRLDVDPATRRFWSRDQGSAHEVALIDRVEWRALLAQPRGHLVSVQKKRVHLSG
ncbi:hypothetical protein [Thiococcus pfennigii]|uniref:hypothetical protein n=1 Tax=Thiococcus pfennigii TaxID=1057 RepID=UPI00190626D8|nr:hypothetical protein [Thiococcus pfennigii]MBK1732306.1 hypothetical protein [Thiococcus pfennigii]